MITEWRRLGLPFTGETFIVAVSGGADSASLLLALHDIKEREKFDLRFVTAHFNHALRGPESDADEEFVKHLTTKLGFELALGRGNISHEGNLEQNARIARYAFLTETAKNLKVYGVLTAHTMNDQVETFLLNLVRGSGVDGLSGMKAVRSLNFQDQNLVPETLNLDPLLIRPMLNWAKRIDTENFCHENEVEYRYDTMNEDMAFKRVRIRKILLPMLMDLNPNIIETLANTANLMRGTEPAMIATGFITARAKNSVAIAPGYDMKTADRLVSRPAVAKTLIDTGELTLKHLKSLTKPELYSTLRSWLDHKRGNLRSLELKHIEAIERLIVSRKSGKTIELPNGERVVKQEGKLVFTKIKVDK